jgi:hypothetical protein
MVAEGACICMSLLTIVVPIGEDSVISNLESWVARLNYEDIQLILVYDGKELRGYERLRHLLDTSLIEKKKLLTSSSRNPGGTRNIGLEAANGQWLYFCDADDLPEIHNVLEAIEAALPQTELIVGQYTKIDSRDGRELFRSNTKSISSLLEEVGLWRILFRAATFSEVRFPETSMGEDQVYLLFCSVTMRSIQFNDVLFYNYFCSIPGQLTNHVMKLDQLKESVEIASGSLGIHVTPNAPEAQFQFEILMRMVLTYCTRSFHVLGSFRLFSLVWEGSNKLSFLCKCQIIAQVVTKILKRAAQI